MFNKLFHWYFTRRALPYWAVLFADLLICYVSGILVFWFYYHGAVTLGNILPLTKTIFVYMMFSVVGFRVFHTYSGIIRLSSFVDLQRVALAQVVNCALAEVWHYVIYYSHWHFIRLEGRQILLMYVIATVLMMAMRVLAKTLYDESAKGSPALIYGLSPALAKSIRNDRSMPFHLSGFIASGHGYVGRTIMGVNVYPADGRLSRVIRNRGIRAVLVAPNEMKSFRHDTALQDLLLGCGVRIYMSQGLQEWHEGDALDIGAFHEIAVADLLPRAEIQIDMQAIGGMLSGHRILVTGAAGSIGSELVRQIAAFAPSDLILVDQAETPQHDMRLMMRRDFPNVRCETIVVSITQRQRMEHIFKTLRPEVVFHAAAYKHVPMMEDNPCEAVYNNIYGTKVVADLCVRYGVGKMVMVSTDKAVNPTSVMGCSKRICEIYCQSLNAYLHGGGQQSANHKPQTSNLNSQTEFVTTRFGNVLGSNGSVVPLFEKQIKAGGPVTVTDPRVIRFFMLVPEACRLVLEAGTQGKGGQIFVFDMGEPVKIVDLARRMIQLSGRTGVEIVYTGLRDGEKLYEEVLASDEVSEPSFNPKIRIAKVRQYDFAEVSRDIDSLISTSLTFDNEAVIAAMRRIVPEYVDAAIQNKSRGKPVAEQNKSQDKPVAEQNKAER